MSLETLSGIQGIEVHKGADLTKMSTMRLKTQGDLVLVKNTEALREFVKNVKSYIVLGWGANQLLRQESDRPYLKLDFPFNREILGTVQDQYTLPASVSLPTLTSAANKLKLSGWEVFTGIPASLGGAVAMNAGTGLGEMAQVTKSFKVMNKNGEVRKVICAPGTFSYRTNNDLEHGDVVFEVVLGHEGIDESVPKTIKDYLSYRNSTQPMSAKTCGCIFKNHIDAKTTCRAGQSLDRIGLKGFKYKNLRVSPKHANFIENLGDSTFEDVMELIEILKEKLKDAYGVEFEMEVR